MKHFCFLIYILFTVPTLSFSQEKDTSVVLSSNIDSASKTVQEPQQAVQDKQSFEKFSSEYKEPSQKRFSPYKTRFWVDVPIISTGVGLTAFGVYLISEKDSLSLHELQSLSKDEVPGFDKGNVGRYSKSADRTSYIPFQASFAAPVAMALLNGKERKKFAQVMVLYLETMSITGALFTMTTGMTYRERPYVYGTEAPLDIRLDHDSRRSFYAGHTAATAAATFFTAKVFADFNPDSKLKPLVWAAAAAVPAYVGFLRYKAGMHFLSDNIIGYVIGAGTGILVPALHKKKIIKNLTLLPESGRDYKGLSLLYKF